MITALLALLRHRNIATPDVLALADQPLGRDRSHREPPITALRVFYRILHGFTPPVAESAAIVAALRSGGWPAQLVIGAEPLPTDSGQRLVHAWIEIGGRTMGTCLPADSHLVGFARYPETA